MCALCRWVYPVEAVLLEEDRAVGQRRRARPSPIRAAACPPAVRCHALVALPVLEVPKLAAIKLVHGLAVHHAILAAPEPVSALGHIVHVRHAPLGLYRPARQLRCLVDKAHDHDVALRHVVENVRAVERFHLLTSGQPAQLDSIVLGKSLSDAVRRELEIDRRHRHPLRGCRRVLLQRVHASARVDPVLAVCRVLRLIALRIAHRDCRAVHRAERNAELPARAKRHAVCVPHVAVVRILFRVKVNAVREDAEIRAHRHDLLLPARDLHRRHILCHRIAGDVELLVVDPAKRIPRDKRLRAVQLPVKAPLRPLAQKRVVLRAQIFHVVKLAVSNFEIVVVPSEGFGCHRAFLGICQCWHQHRPHPFRSCIHRYAPILRSFLREFLCLLAYSFAFLCIFLIVFSSGSVDQPKSAAPEPSASGESACSCRSTAIRPPHDPPCLYRDLQPCARRIPKSGSCG